MLKRFTPCGVDVLAACLCAGGFMLPFLNSKANRLVAGDPVYLANIPGMFWPVIPAVIAVLVFTGRFRRAEVFRVAVVSAVLVWVTLLSGTFAKSVMAASAFSRVSFSTGYWIFFLGCFLFFMQAYTVTQNPFKRLLYLVFMVAPPVLIVMSGRLDSMSVMLEYANYSGRFYRELFTHIAISFGSVLLACAAGIPLGIFSAKRPGRGGKVFDFLNIVQTVPSIALFGLLMVPLAWLSTRSELLRDAGVSGIGWAPAVIALFLYSLLPVVRNTYEGIKSIDSGVLEAAKGVGMTSSDVLLKVELPLSLPVILNGSRVALVQSIGNTAVVSLIGAGGLGIFIFQGLGQSAVPLIMLGTIPTILLAVLADGGMHLIISLTKRQ